jgi:hypothetical protein
MSLITEIASAGADSYVTLGEAQEYLSGRSGFDASGWEALTDVQKEFQLRLGTRIVDSLSYRGMTATRNQALAFPRIFQRDALWIENATGIPMPFNDWESLQEYADLRGLSGPAIPEDVKFAQIEITFQVVFSHLMTLEPMSTGEMDITSLSVGGISLSFGKGQRTVYDLFTKDQFGAIAPVRLYLRKYLGAKMVLV